jgi:hypothetical protein
MDVLGIRFLIAALAGRYPKLAPRIAPTQGRLPAWLARTDQIFLCPAEFCRLSLRDPISFLRIFCPELT